MSPKYKKNYEKLGDSSSQAHQENRSLLESDSDEDFLFSGAKPGITAHKNERIKRLQGQVGEVVGVMKNNISKVLDRGERLDQLQDKSDLLSSNSSMFQHRSRALHRQMWWNNCKFRLIVFLVVIIILTVIIVPIVIKYSNKK